MNDIPNTIDLPIKIQLKYIKTMMDLHILTINQENKPCVTPFYHKTFEFLQKNGLDQYIKSEIQDNELANTVMIGGCLLLFGVQKQDLFHSLNLVSEILQKNLILNNDCNKILEWIDYCFPYDDKMKTIIDMKKPSFLQ